MKIKECLPRRYLICSIVTSVGGLLNGLDTGVIGLVTVMSSFTATFGKISSSLHGLVVSCVLLSATFASLFSGTLSDTLGRTRALAAGAFVFGVGAVFEASAGQLGILILGRLVVGAGEGLFLSTLVVYICEISPAKIRGPLASMVQLFITIGLVVGFFMCYGTVKNPTSFSWRFPFALQAGISFALSLAALYYLPESPRWLNHRGHPQKAERAWARLEVAMADRGSDTIEDSVRHEHQTVNGLVGQLSLYYHNGILNLRRVMGPASKKQALLAVFLMSMQQLSGIDGVLYYAPLLFQQAGLSSSEASFLASGVSAILIFATSIPAFLLTDKIGRRASTLYGGVVLSVIMAIIGSLYASGSVHQTFGSGRWVVIVSIYLFSISYCMTWALGIKVYASEIQPVPTRATVTSLAQSANCLTNFFVALITPTVLQKSSFGIYFLFCGCTIVTVAVCALFMPETRGRPLETISEVFSSTSRHALHGARQRRVLGRLQPMFTSGAQRP